MPATETHSSTLVTPLQRRLVIVGMMAGVSLAALDQMVLATAAASISGDLGDLTQAPWLFTANLLTSASSMPIWGKLGDLYGRRRVFQSAIALFIVASLLAANSESMIQLVLCRGLQGLGSGALLTMPYAILGDVVSPRQRPAYVVFVTVMWTTAGFLGPPLGGFLVDGPGWRWMFYINVPAGLLALGLIQFAYRLPRDRIEHELDLLGGMLLFTSVGTLIFYTSWAGGALGYGSPAGLSLLALSIALGAGFFVQERRATEPMVELSLFRRRAVWPPLLTTSLFGFANFAIAFFIPLYGIVVRGSSAVEAGLALMPLTTGLLISGIYVGRQATRTQRFRRYATGGLLIYISGLVCLMQADADTSQLAFWGCNLLLGLGSGTINPVVVVSLQNAVEARYLGVASSLPGFARAISQTIGTSALGALLASRFGDHLELEVAPIAPRGTVLDGLVESPEAIRALTDPLYSAVIEAYRSAFNETFFVMAMIMTASLIASTWIRDVRR